MLLSVIICVKDGEKYIARAINSIANQPRFDEIELVVVNDGSKDNTENIIDSFYKRYKNIKILKHANNVGVGSSRNDGIKLATSKYISFLDADDWWEKNFFDDELIELLNKDYDLYGFSFQKISYDYLYKVEHNEESRIIANKNEIAYTGQLLWAFIYQKNIIDKYKLEFFNTKINEDITFTQRYFEMIDNINYSNKMMYNYYMNSNSIMHGPYSNELFNETIKSLELLDLWYKNNKLTYHKEHPMLFYTAQKLPYLCAINSYDELENVLSSNPDIFYVLENYKRFPIDNNLMNRIRRYNRNSHMFYIMNKIMYGIKEHIRLSIYKTHMIRKLETHLLYGVVLKAKKISHNELIQGDKCQN